MDRANFGAYGILIDILRKTPDVKYTGRKIIDRSIIHEPNKMFGFRQGFFDKPELEGRTAIVHVFDIPVELFRKFDRIEHYIQGNEEASLYIRKQVTTVDGLEIQVYEFNQ